MQSQTNLLLAAAIFLALFAAACDSSNNNNDNPQPECTAGEQGCECLEANACNAGLICVNAICIPDDTDEPDADDEPDVIDEPDGDDDPDVDAPVDGLGLAVDKDNARACEAVLTDAAGGIEAVAFGEGVKGRFMRRGERLAVAFIADGDAPIADNAVELVLKDGFDDLASIQITVASCSDAGGAPIEGTQITINDQR